MINAAIKPRFKKVENELSNSYFPLKRRPWGPKRRLLQRQRILAVRPWLRATGPRTRQGRIVSARNALKTGAYNRFHKALRRALSYQAQYLRLLRLNDYHSSPALMQMGNAFFDELLVAFELEDRDKSAL